MTTIIGVVGAVVGGGIARAFGLGDPIDEFFDVSTWLAATPDVPPPAGRIGGARTVAACRAPDVPRWARRA